MSMPRVVVCGSPDAAGTYGAAEVAARLNAVLAEHPHRRARLLLSTGQSQFETLRDLVRRPVDWSRVDAFHLDEYVGLDTDHPASFRRYLRERVSDLVPLRLHEVDPSSSTALEALSSRVAEAPMDVALVGIGENGHLAFNDPPADLETTVPYLEVTLDDRCRAQQVHEGWFETVADVPARAITMSIHEIMRADEIVSVVPHAAKAPVIARLLGEPSVTPHLPASMLACRERVTIVLDRASAALIPDQQWKRCVVL